MDVIRKPGNIVGVAKKLKKTIPLAVTDLGGCVLGAPAILKLAPPNLFMLICWYP